MEKKRFHIMIHGHVQGVFFRSEAQKQARELSIKGWVKNNPDGTVEIVAQGKEENINQFLRWCRHGPDPARVDDIDIIEEKTDENMKEEPKNFSIRY